MPTTTDTIPVMLNPNWQGSFRRVIRDEDGVAMKDDAGKDIAIEFVKGETQFLSNEQFECIRKDVGRALCFALPNGKPDWEMTKAHAEDVAGE